MRYTFDASHGTLYIELSDAMSATQVEMDDGVIVDLSADGEVIGVEVISAQHPFNLGAVAERFGMDAEQVALMLGAATPPQLYMVGQRTAQEPAQTEPESLMASHEPRVLVNAGAASNRDPS